MGEFLEVCPKRLCISTVGKRTDLFERDPYKVPITDFFGSVRNVELTGKVENLTKKAILSSMSSKASTISLNYHYAHPLPILQEIEKSIK
jgi:phosphatidylinositol glycan class K